MAIGIGAALSMVDSLDIEWGRKVLKGEISRAVELIEKTDPAME